MTAKPSKNAVGRKSDISTRRWWHVPLWSGWCLEWPDTFIASPVCVVSLTTEIPWLLAFPPWAALVDRRLDAALRRAVRASPDDVARIWATLAGHAKGKLGNHLSDDERLALDEVRRMLRSRARIAGVRVGRHRVRGQGPRFKTATLADYDAYRVRRAAYPDETREASIDAVAQRHRDYTPTDMTEQKGAFSRVKKNVQRVVSQTVEFPYAFVRCKQHDGEPRAIRATPSPIWVKRAAVPPTRRQAEEACTRSFRPLVWDPQGEAPMRLVKPKS